MNFSFPPLPARLADPRLRRLGPALLTGLFCQLLLLIALPSHGPEPRRSRRTVQVDDSPTLLRWSRTPSRAADAAALQTIPLQGLSVLPPPPPPLSSLPGGSLPVRPSPSPRPVLASPPLADGLPRQPGEAFRLARQVAMSGLPKDSPAIALVAVQRRQWWLLPSQGKLLVSLWEAAVDLAPPAALGPLPDGVAIRKATAAAAAPLALGELHGRSLLEADQLWLFWRQGPTLWMLRAPLVVSEP